MEICCLWRNLWRTSVVVQNYWWVDVCPILHYGYYLWIQLVIDTTIQRTPFPFIFQQPFLENRNPLQKFKLQIEFFRMQYSFVFGFSVFVCSKFRNWLSKIKSTLRQLKLICQDLQKETKKKSLEFFCFSYEQNLENGWTKSKMSNITWPHLTRTRRRDGKRKYFGFFRFSYDQNLENGWPKSKVVWDNLTSFDEN